MTLTIFRFLCFLQDKIYTIQGILARRLNNGIHPKKNIINYGAWFLEHIPPGSSVVDIGCGRGELVELFLEYGHEARGIEIDRRNVSDSLYDRGLIHVCDAMNVDFRRFGNFAVAIMSNSLEHFCDRNQLLINIHSGLQKTSGMLLVRVPTSERDWLTIFKRDLNIPFFLDSTHFVEYSVRELKDELSKAGFEVVIDKVAYGEIYAICRVK